MSNKNAYEIRTEILEMARGLITDDFHNQYQTWEMTAPRDNQGLIITTRHKPEFPSLESILETAEKMYKFVEQK